MLTTETIKNSLQNLHQYLKRYNIDMYYNIEKKLLPFTELFCLENKTPYGLSEDEAHILRLHIGIYDSGKKQSIEKIAKIYGCKRNTIQKKMMEIFRKINNPTYQKIIEDERNKLIREGIKNEQIRVKVLNMDIDFFILSPYLIKMLKSNNIKTLKNLIDMDIKDIKKLNLNSDIDIVIFPKKIINTVHALGLEFKDEIEEEFIQMYIKMGRADKRISETLKNKLKLFGINVETKMELLSIYKFEPDTLNILTEYEMNAIREELSLNNHKNDTITNNKNNVMAEYEITEESKDTVLLNNKTFASAIKMFTKPSGYDSTEALAMILVLIQKYIGNIDSKIIRNLLLEYKELTDKSCIEEIIKKTEKIKLLLLEPKRK